MQRPKESKSNREPLSARFLITTFLVVGLAMDQITTLFWLLKWYGKATTPLDHNVFINFLTTWFGPYAGLAYLPIEAAIVVGIPWLVMRLTISARFPALKYLLFLILWVELSFASGYNFANFANT